jgi:hypothetical protein
VGDEDPLKRETDSEAHHLPLGALTAVQEEQVAFPLEGDR